MFQWLKKKLFGDNPPIKSNPVAKTCTATELKDKYQDLLKTDQVQYNFTPEDQQLFNEFEQHLRANKSLMLDSKLMLLKATPTNSVSNLDFYKLIKTLLEEFTNFKNQSFEAKHSKQALNDKQQFSLALSSLEAIRANVKNLHYREQGQISIKGISYYYQVMDQYYQQYLTNAGTTQNFDLYDFSNYSAPSDFVANFFSDPDHEKMVNEVYNYWTSSPSFPFESPELSISNSHLDKLIKMLPLISLAKVARKTTFLPLSYHEIFLDFFGDISHDEEKERQVKNRRRLVISNEDDSLLPMVIEILIQAACKYDLIESPSYYVDINVKNFKADLADYTDHLFLLTLLLRRKINNHQVNLFEKDIELVLKHSFFLGVDTDYHQFYLFLKHLGL